MEENSKNTTQTKQNWFKSHMTVCIIAVIIVIAAVVGIVLLTNNKGGQSPEKVVETYVQAMQDGNVDKIMEMTDIKGAYAWEQCGRDASKFQEEYNKISDSDAQTYKDTLKSGLDAAIGMLKAFGGVQMSINNMEKPEELAKDLYKIKANAKMKVSVFGVDQEQDQDLILVVYNGRYIGEASE